VNRPIPAIGSSVVFLKDNTAKSEQDSRDFLYGYVRDIQTGETGTVVRTFPFPDGSWKAMVEVSHNDAPAWTWAHDWELADKEPPYEAQLSRLDAAAKRLYSENRMSGDEMRDMAQMISAAVEILREGE